MLTEAHTDFCFALFSEEFGFLNCIRYAALLWMILQPFCLHREYLLISWYLLVVQPCGRSGFTECWHVLVSCYYCIAFYQLWINIDDCPARFCRNRPVCLQFYRTKTINHGKKEATWANLLTSVLQEFRGSLSIRISLIPSF